jgi:hypothetical protein
MAALGFLLIAVIVFMFGWNQVGATDAKTTGIISGAAALLMAAAVVFQGASVFGASATAPVGALILLWAIYGGLIAGMGLTDTGGRAVGLYSLFLSVAMIAFAVWFFVNGPIIGSIVTVAVGIPFFLQFLEYVGPVRGLAPVAGYMMLVAGVIAFASGAGLYLGLLV